jgi:hypothetical protein
LAGPVDPLSAAFEMIELKAKSVEGAGKLPGETLSGREGSAVATGEVVPKRWLAVARRWHGRCKRRASRAPATTCPRWHRNIAFESAIRASCRPHRWDASYGAPPPRLSSTCATYEGAERKGSSPSGSSSSSDLSEV